MIYVFYGLTVFYVISFCILNYFISSNVKQVVAVCIFSLFGCLMWTYSFNGLTGNPREASMNILYEEGTSRYLKDFHIYKKESIFMWIVDDETIKSYRFPWSKELAKILFEMKYQEKRTGKKTMIDVNKLSNEHADGGGDNNLEEEGATGEGSGNAENRAEHTGDELDKDLMDRIKQSFEVLDGSYEEKE